MGTVDPNQQIEVKKSARQIYAEAFMDDDNPMYRRTNQYADYMDEDQAKEYSEKMQEEAKLSAEEKARQAFEQSLIDEDEEEDDSQAEADEDEKDLLDELTGNVDEEDEEETDP